MCVVHLIGIIEIMRKSIYLLISPKCVCSVTINSLDLFTINQKYVVLFIQFNISHLFLQCFHLSKKENFVIIFCFSGNQNNQNSPNLWESLFCLANQCWVMAVMMVVANRSGNKSNNYFEPINMMTNYSNDRQEGSLHSGIWVS